MDDIRADGVLARECRTFVGYLVGGDATPDIVSAYERAHTVSAVRASRVSAPLDRALLAVARSGPRSARAADAFAGLFARASVLRRKLALLVAILESREPTAAMLDRPYAGARAAGFLAAVLNASASVARACLAMVVIGPLCLWYRVAGRDAGVDDA